MQYILTLYFERRPPPPPAALQPYLQLDENSVSIRNDDGNAPVTATLAWVAGLRNPPWSLDFLNFESPGAAPIGYILHVEDELRLLNGANDLRSAREPHLTVQLHADVQPNLARRPRGPIDRADGILAVTRSLLRNVPGARLERSVPVLVRGKDSVWSSPTIPIGSVLLSSLFLAPRPCNLGRHMNRSHVGVFLATESLPTDFGWVQDSTGFGCNDTTRVCAIDRTVKQFLFPGRRTVLGPAYLQPLFSRDSPEAEHVLRIMGLVPLSTGA